MRLAPLDNSVVFKKLFRDPEVLTEFFKDLTGIQLHLTAENIELEKRFTPPVGMIDIAFDIFAEDPEQRVIVEIQRVYYTYLLDRFIHYHHAAIMEMQRNYKQYTPTRTVYTIAWLTMKSEDPPYNQGVSRSRYYFESTKKVKSAEFRHPIYLINPNYIDSSVPPAIADWLKLVAESIDNPASPAVNLQRPILRKATDIIAEEAITPSERAAIMDDREWQQKLQESSQKGLQQGIEIGRGEGIELGQRMLVRSMVARGAAMSTIIEMTGLSKAEVAALVEKDLNNGG